MKNLQTAIVFFSCLAWMHAKAFSADAIEIPANNIKPIILVEEISPNQAAALPFIIEGQRTLDKITHSDGFRPSPALSAAMKDCSLISVQPIMMGERGMVVIELRGITDAADIRMVQTALVEDLKLLLAENINVARQETLKALRQNLESQSRDLSDQLRKLYTRPKPDTGELARAASALDSATLALNFTSARSEAILATIEKNTGDLKGSYPIPPALLMLLDSLPGSIRVTASVDEVKAALAKVSAKADFDADIARRTFSKAQERYEMAKKSVDGSITLDRQCSFFESELAQVTRRLADVKKKQEELESNMEKRASVVPLQ